MSKLQSFEARLERALAKIDADHRATRDDQPSDVKASSPSPPPAPNRDVTRPTFANKR